MSELERSEHVSPHTDSGRPTIDDLTSVLAHRSVVEREGLPQNYRMRADSHYVDQLDSPRACPAIRLIATNDIEIAEPTSSDRVGALAQSVATHGILQPLLVRRHNGRYRLIAGRKRLAAAIAVGIVDVPCFVHEADDAKAATLAEADNFRETSAPRPAPAFSDAERLGDVLRTMAAELTRLEVSTALLKVTPSASFQHRIAADLMHAQSWRSRWLAVATAAIVGPATESRPKALNLVFDRVKAGFEAESRLTRLQLNFTAPPTAAAVPVDEDLGVTAVTGAVIATISWLQNVDEPRVEVHADLVNARTLRVEIVQRAARVSPAVAECLQDPSNPGSADLMAVTGLLAAKFFAAQHGGTVEFSALRGRGSVIQMTVGQG